MHGWVMRKRVRTTNRNAVSGGDVVIVTPGDTDYLAPAGTNTDDIDRTIIEFGPVDMGDETSSVPSDEAQFELTTSAGAEDSSYGASESTFAGNLSVGEESSEAQDGFSMVFGAQPIGSTDADVSASSVTNVNDFVYTATATNSGDVGWEDEANAEGVENGTVASIVVEAGIGVVSTDSDLELLFTAAAAPTGTRSSVTLRIHHALDTTLNLTSSATATLDLTKSDGSSPLNLITSIRATTSPIGDQDVRPNNTIPVDEIFDITSHVSSWTENELANARLICHLEATIISLGGDARWFIDSAAIVRSYTVTGIT